MWTGCQLGHVDHHRLMADEFNDWNLPGMDWSKQLGSDFCLVKSGGVGRSGHPVRYISISMNTFVTFTQTSYSSSRML